MLKKLQTAKMELRAEKARGFSLVELIIVVAILAILVAIAIPIFANIQGQAADSAAKASAANGSATVAAAVADNPSVTTADLNTLLGTMSSDLSLTAPAAGTTVTLSNYCVTATYSGGTQTSGPGCTP